MAFWTYCCKWPQVYRTAATYEFPNIREQSGGVGNPQLDGSPKPPYRYQGYGNFYSIDNEGDWICLSERAGIQRDGTLWCWIPQVVNIKAFQYGATTGENTFSSTPLTYYLSQNPAYPPEMPVKISEDTDWKFVTSDENHGFAIKNDGSLWAFGFEAYGCLGVGLSKYALSGRDVRTNEYRAKLSCSIKEVVVSGGTYAKYSAKPSVELRFYVKQYQQPDYRLDSELGTGATLEVDWTGSVGSSDLTLTSGGSGYTSAPTVVLVPSSSEDNGKTLAGTVEMSQVNVKSIDVLRGGVGYTYATATELATGAVATAEIDEFGSITAWTISSYGTKMVSLTNPQGVSVKIEGDGNGATASVTLNTGSVVKVTFPDVSMWTSKPTVQFTGGGGSGAAATVAKILGFVNGVRVTNGGSGYTQSMGAAVRYYTYYSDMQGQGQISPVFIRSTEDYLYEYPDQREVVGNAYVVLNEGPVVEFTQALGMSARTGLEKQSTGEMGPFDLYLNPGQNYSTSVELISPYVDAVPLTVKSRPQFGDSIYEKTGTHAGYKYPPFIRIKRQSPNASNYSTNKQFSYETAAVADSACAATGNGSSQGYHALKKLQFGAWPSGCGDVTVTSDTGATLKLVNIDGNMEASERTWVSGYPPGWYGYANESATGITVSQEPTPFTGPVFSETWNIDTYGYYLSVSSAWVPWSIGETIRIYVEPPSTSGDAPYGEAAPGSDGVALPPVMVKQGTGLYTEEPLCLSVSAIFEMPVRVLGGETWKSVAIEGDKTIGVTTSGQLYWWGINAANGGGRGCPFPSPVGQGVVFDVTPAGGGSEYKAKGLRDDYYNYYGYSGGARTSVGVPQHGIHIAALPTLGNFNAATRQIAYTTNFQGNIVISSLDQKIVNDSLPAKNRWFAPPPDSLAKFYGASGIGYTSPPSVEIHSVGEPIVSASSRLVGPTSFTEVKDGGYARTSSGQWLYAWYRGYYDGNYYTFLNWNWGLGSFGTSVYYSYASVSTNRKAAGYYYLSKDDIDKEVTVNSRTYAGSVFPSIAHIKDGGSGYSSATATISYSELRPWEPAAATENTEVTCSYSSGATTKVITKSVSTYTYSPSLTTKTTQATLSVAGVSGRIMPWSASLGSVIQPSVAVSGDGSGGQASIVDAVDYATQWGTLVVQSPVGMSTELSSSLVSLSDSGDISLFPYKGLNASYTAPQYSDVFTSLAGATRARAGDDGSVWEIAVDGSGGMAVARMFPLSLSLVSTGSGYDSPATAIVSQQPGVAKAEVTFDAKVQAIGVMSPGSRYTAPPDVTLEAVGGGTPGTATAVIAGPVDQVTVTNAGSGYRLPPRVVFSGTGISPYATCTLNQYGGVEAVSISSGGRYRDAPPTVSFVPIQQVESLALGSGGDGYSIAPKVYIGGGGGSGAAATCRIRAQVIEIELISGGSGYTSEPTVAIVEGMGNGATATASVDENGIISSITLDEPGDFYQFPPMVSITGGGGTGAYAVAKIAGYVDLITLTSRGSEYVNPPEVYFYDGVDGGGASATATIAGAGSGATATARLNGSIIFCKHNSDSSGLQNPPKVVVSASTNPSLTALNQRLAAGDITAAEHKGLSAAYAASLKSAIVGKVTAVNVTDGGSGYKPNAAGWGNEYWTGAIGTSPNVDDPRIAPQAYLTPTHCVGQVYDNVRPSGRYGSLGIPALKTFVSEAGAVTSVALDDATKNLEFVKKPSVVFLDGIAATPYTCLTRCGAAITDATTVTVPPSQSSDPYYASKSLARWSGGEYAGTKAASNQEPQAKNAVTVICVNGGIKGFSIGVGSDTAYRDATLIDFAKGGFYFYDPVPTVVIEDEKGTGAAAAMATFTPAIEPMEGVLAYSNRNYSYGFSFPGFTITAPGSGYTVNAKVRFVGGSPFCWKQENKATATATAEGGMVTAISVTSQGKGYNTVPDVVIYDGGGKGATAVARVVLGRITAIEVTSEGTDYKSNPKVAIIDRDVLFDRSDKGKLIQSAFDSYATPYLNPYTAEYCLQGERVQNTIISHLDIIPKELNASFVPFFDDDGYVEDIHWNVGDRFRHRPLLAAPVVTATPGESTDLAQYTASIVSWSDVMSETCLKKQ